MLKYPPISVSLVLERSALDFVAFIYYMQGWKVKE